LKKFTKNIRCFRSAFESILTTKVSPGNTGNETIHIYVLPAAQSILPGSQSQKIPQLYKSIFEI